MFSKIIEIYYDVESQGDPVVKKWFLMKSMWFPITIVLAYLCIIFLLGPKLMKNRKAFSINNVILFYNIVQVIFNAYLFKAVIFAVLHELSSFRCFKVLPVDTEWGNYQRIVNWLFTLNKLLDLLDTIFFVMKKKQSHITFLHVYHHVLTFTVCWVVCKYFPGGQIAVIGVLNSFVHCVMYSYYLLSLIERFKRITRFMKKRITQMQIAQFILAGMHGLYGLTDPTCNYPKFLTYFGLSQGVLMIVLFIDFYRKAYTSKSHKMDHQLQNGSIKNGFTKKMH